MTTAEQIAERFDNDGRRFTDSAGIDLDSVCAAHVMADGCQNTERRREWRDGYGTDVYRWAFKDGSVITVAGDGWDLGYADCWCWRGAGHSDVCEVRS